MGMLECAKSWSTRWRKRILESGGQKFWLKKEWNSIPLAWRLNLLRCVAQCSCGTPKGIVFTLSETPAQPANDDAEKGENNCIEHGVNYFHRRFLDNKHICTKHEKKTDTWQECQKNCAECEQCNFFTWHKPTNNRWKNVCALSHSFGFKHADTTVSGPKECPKSEWWCIG